MIAALFLASSRKKRRISLESVTSLPASNETMPRVTVSPGAEEPAALEGTIVTGPNTGLEGTDVAGPTVCSKKPLPLPFNETERNGPFTIHSSSVRGPCVFAVHFESVLIKYY